MTVDLSITYFSRFGLSGRFPIGQDDLTARYRRLQGECETVEHCRCLAKFSAPDIPPMVAGAAPIRVIFQADARRIAQRRRVWIEVHWRRVREKQRMTQIIGLPHAEICPQGAVIEAQPGMGICDAALRNGIGIEESEDAPGRSGERILSDPIGLDRRARANIGAGPIACPSVWR